MEMIFCDYCSKRIVLPEKGYQLRVSARAQGIGLVDDGDIHPNEAKIACKECQTGFTNEMRQSIKEVKLHWISKAEHCEAALAVLKGVAVCGDLITIRIPEQDV